MSVAEYFPKPLLEDLAGGRWLPIVGAGLSRNAEVPTGSKMPLWDDLGRALARDIAGHEYVGAVDAISSYEHEFDRRALVARLHRELLVDHARPGLAHIAFCRLPFDRVVTTNFDFLLEHSYDQVGARCDVVLDEEQLSVPARQRAITLVKLHGDLRHPGRLIVTEHDYDRFLSDYPMLATHVASLLIERVPVLIGYSLDDPDLRQLLATLRGRLGAVLPKAYAVGVEVAPSVIARFERRGVGIINLPGRKENYNDILATTFEELDRYWREGVLARAEFTEERPLEEIETAAGGTARRLCYFAVPASRQAIIREQIYPLAEDAGLIPVSGFDVEVDTGNVLAAVGALLERSQAAVVDASTGVGSTELNAALQLLGTERVGVISHGTPPAWVVVSGVRWFSGETPDVYSDIGFLGKLREWFVEQGKLAGQRGSEVGALLEAKLWRAALVAAISDLEAELRPRFGVRSIAGARRWPTFRDLLASAQLDDALHHRLLDAVGLRNVALHEGATVSQADAERTAADVQQAIASLNG